MTTAVELITTERARQQSAAGYTPEHDDRYTHEELVRAAICYAYPPNTRQEVPVKPGALGEGWEACATRDAHYYIPELWPWPPEDWKPAGRLTELVRSAALIAAEIDRLIRQGVLL